MTLTLHTWGQWIGVLAAETAVIILWAAGACRFVRKPQRQRVCWQAALIAVALVFASEMAGLRGWVDSAFPSAAAPRHLAVILPEAGARRNPPPASDLVEAPPDSSAAAATPARWPGWIWISGTIALLLYSGGTRAWLLLERRKMPLAGGEEESAVKPLLVHFRLRRVELRGWKRARGPVAFGVWRPTVALPPDFAVRFTPAQRQVMLAHELAHLAADDPCWLTLADSLCALTWWHPLVWWMRRRFRATCEAAADEASALLPTGPATLAESLLAFGRELSLSTPTRGLGVAGSGFQSELGLRVTALLASSMEWRNLSRTWRWSSRLLGIVLAAIMVVLPFPAGCSSPMFAALVGSLTHTADAPPPSMIGTAPMWMAASAVDRTTNAAPGAKAGGRSLDVTVQFVKVPEDRNAAKFTLDAEFQHLQTRDLAPEIGPVADDFPSLKRADPNTTSVDRLQTEGQSLALSSAEFSALESSLTRQTGVEWLSVPTTVSTSGGELHLQITDEKTIVFEPLGLVHTNRSGIKNAPPTVFDTGNVSLGSSAIIIPKAEGDDWRIEVRAKCVEFLGYDNPKTYVLRPAGKPAPFDPPEDRPLPHFCVRQSQASAVAQLGQTLVVRGPLAPERKVINAGLFRSFKIQTTTNRFYVFVTLAPSAKIQSAHDLIDKR